jgi:hypothetical protein
MKKIAIVFISLISVQFAVAQQLTKSEKKSLKKEIKTLKKDPVKYQNILENSSKKDATISDLNYEIAALKKIIETQENDCTSKIDALKNQLSAGAGDNCGINSSGKNYRVQVGLYKFFDISSMLNNPKFLEYERADDMYRYSIGNFRTHEEAENFKNEVRKMGITDAFVSEYENGVRLK